MNDQNTGASTSADQDDYDFHLTDDNEHHSECDDVETPEPRTTVENIINVEPNERLESTQKMNPKRPNEDAMEREKPSKRTRKYERLAATLSEDVGNKLTATLTEEIRNTLASNQNTAIAFGNFVGQALNWFSVHQEIIFNFFKILSEIEPNK